MYHRFGLNVDIQKSSQESKTVVFQLPTIREFTVKLGAECIRDFIEKSISKRDLAYHIRYMDEKKDLTSNFHFYSATFSFPTYCYPVSQVMKTLLLILNTVIFFYKTKLENNIIYGHQKN